MVTQGHTGRAEPPSPDLLDDLAGARAAAAAATGRTRARERAPAPQPAAELPVARVLVDLPLAHLDRPFDYLVSEAQHADAVPGARVKARFAGQDVNGFVLDRARESGHPGTLAPLRRVVSAEPVLSAHVARLCAAVAARYAGTRSDVLRLAVPPRHARVEATASPDSPPVVPDPVAAAAAWEPYRAGPAFLRRVAAGAAPRSVWTALPGAPWPSLLAQAAAAAAGAGRGALLCVPDRRDLDRLDGALSAVLGPGRHVVLTADVGPAERYRRFLAVSRGAVRVVAGTRAAAFAPVRDLGLVAMWDDGDDLYAEPRAPYPHTREVLLLRAHEESCAVLLGGLARTVEGEQLLAGGWARELSADRATVRSAAPRIGVAGAGEHELRRDPWAHAARVPSTAHEAIREGLETGPVLVQTPRQGYAASLVCDTCRGPARCAACGGPLQLPGAGAPPRCRWCGVEEGRWACPGCGRSGLRAPVLGDRRTAEELGRAFPRTAVRRSTGERVLDAVGPEPAIVVATPGAEPLPVDGYSAVVLLDTWLMLARPDLRTGEECLRRWLNAAGLARPAARGGRVVAVGDAGDPALQALVRWDPAGFASRESAERRSAHLPPASRLATLTGPSEHVEAALAALALPRGAEVLGPAPVPATPGSAPAQAGGEEAPDPTVRAVVRVPREAGGALSMALRELQGTRSARKLPLVRVQVDPATLG